MPDYATEADIANLQAQINALDVRVSKLEGGGQAMTPSPDGTTVTDTSGQIVDSALRCFRLIESATQGYRIDCDGTVSGGGVVRLYAMDGECYQENADGHWWFLPAEALSNDGWIACDNPTGEAPPKPISDDYTFADEFETLKLWNRDAPDDSAIWRPTRWYSQDEWSGWDNGDGRMVNPYNQPGCEYLYGVDGDSNLFLAMDRAKQSVHGNCAEQGFVTSQINQLSFKQMGGYWEARIKCPNIRGTNCAFWLMNNVSWPPEIDIVELVTFTDGSALMAQNLWEMDHSTNPYYLWDFDRTAWHTYAVWWDLEARKIRYYFDGRLTQELAQPDGYDHPMFVIISMQQGGDWSGPVPDDQEMGRMLVDYVHISQQPPGAVVNAPQAARSGREPPRKGRGLGSGVRFDR